MSMAEVVKLVEYLGESGEELIKDYQVKTIRHLMIIMTILKGFSSLIIHAPFKKIKRSKILYTCDVFLKETQDAYF